MGAIKIIGRYVSVYCNVCLHLPKTKTIAHFYTVATLDAYGYLKIVCVIVIEFFLELLKFIAFILSEEVISKCPSRAVI
jgi:hypothetical protein